MVSLCARAEAASVQHNSPGEASSGDGSMRRCREGRGREGEGEREQSSPPWLMHLRCAQARFEVGCHVAMGCLLRPFAPPTWRERACHGM